MSSLPLTYTDLVCIDDVDPLAAETGSDLEALAQDVFHILIEDPASNPDDTDRGIGVVSLLSGDASVLQTLPHTVESELEKDDRIDIAKCRVVQIAAGGTYSDGTAVPENGGYELLIQIQPTGAVLPLNLSFGVMPGGLVKTS